MLPGALLQKRSAASAAFSEHEARSEIECLGMLVELVRAIPARTAAFRYRESRMLDSRK